MMQAIVRQNQDGPVCHDDSHCAAFVQHCMYNCKFQDVAHDDEALRSVALGVHMLRIMTKHCVQLRWVYTCVV